MIRKTHMLVDRLPQAAASYFARRRRFAGAEARARAFSRNRTMKHGAQSSVRVRFAGARRQQHASARPHSGPVVVRPREVVTASRRSSSVALRRPRRARPTRPSA